MEAAFSAMIGRSSASGWLLCILAMVGLFGVWKIYAMQRPKMRELEQDGETILRGEMWKDIDELKKGKAALSLELSKIRAEVAEQGVTIGQQRFVLGMVVGELERLEPGNSIARHARLLLDQVQPAAFPQTRREPDADLITALD